MTQVYDFTVLYRGALLNTIYRKTLKLSLAQSRTMGSTASTHMCVHPTFWCIQYRLEDLFRSVDMERICQGMEFINEIWASTLSVGLGIAILYSQVCGIHDPGWSWCAKCSWLLVGDMASLLPHCGHFRIDVNSKYRWPADRQTPNRMAGGNGWESQVSLFDRAQDATYQVVPLWRYCC